MSRTKLTDKLVNSIKRNGKTKDGGDLWDSQVPGLGIRNRGLSYVCAGRFPGSPSFTRRKLASLKALTLDEARQKARKWMGLIEQGKDPAAEEERDRRAELQKRSTTFASVAKAYIDTKVIGPDPKNPLQRNGPEVAREIEQVLIPLWGDRPIVSIIRPDVKAAIEGVKNYGTRKMLATYGVTPAQRSHKRGRPASRQGRPAPGQARNLLGIIKTFFAWAVVHGDCGLRILARRAAQRQRPDRRQGIGRPLSVGPRDRRVLAGDRPHGIPARRSVPNVAAQRLEAERVRGRCVARI